MILGCKCTVLTTESQTFSDVTPNEHLLTTALFPRYTLALLTADVYAEATIGHGLECFSYDYIWEDNRILNNSVVTCEEEI